MAKTLYLLRHAKSSHDDPSLEDIARPLAKRGRRAAEAIGQYIARYKIAPALVLCSTAIRARETLARATEEWPLKAPIEYRQSLYLATAAALIEEVQTLDDELHSVMLVGHNPGMEELAALLTPPAKSARPPKFPTGALAVFIFAGKHWRAVAPGRGRLASIITPRELDAGRDAA
jgi:phosphohistidine phosphatase